MFITSRLLVSKLITATGELSNKNKRILNFDFGETEENAKENFICNFNTLCDSKEIMSEKDELKNKIMRNFYFF